MNYPCVVLLLFRSVVLESRKAASLFGVGLLCFLLSAVADVLGLRFEEVAEVLAAAFVVAAVIVLGLHYTRSGLRENPRRKEIPGSEATPYT